MTKPNGNWVKYTLFQLEYFRTLKLFSKFSRSLILTNSLWDFIGSSYCLRVLLLKSDQDCGVSRQNPPQQATNVNLLSSTSGTQNFSKKIEFLENYLLRHFFIRIIVQKSHRRNNKNMSFGQNLGIISLCYVSSTDIFTSIFQFNNI